MTENHLIEAGLWQEIRTDLRQARATPALFLDRDGILNKDTGHVGDVSQLEIWSHVTPLIRAANAKQWPVIIVTNQSGIARRYYDWQAFSRVNTAILAKLAQHDASINAIFACGYHEMGDALYARKNHDWRKPRPGMLAAAGAFFNITYPKSLIVGDQVKDMKAGHAAGLENGLLIPPDRTIPGTDNMKQLSLMQNLQIRHMHQIQWRQVITDFGFG